MHNNSDGRLDKLTNSIQALLPTKDVENIVNNRVIKYLASKYCYSPDEFDMCAVLARKRQLKLGKANLDAIRSVCF